jgi:hypothetical protein
MSRSRSSGKGYSSVFVETYKCWQNMGTPLGLPVVSSVQTTVDSICTGIRHDDWGVA